MTAISPDLVEWIISDEKVSSRWRQLARRLGFSRYIPELEVGRLAQPARPRGARAASRHRGDWQKLQALFQLWQTLRPEKYTVPHLKALLAAEGLHDMWMWVNMMTQTSPLATQVSEFIYRNIPPSPAPSRNTSSTSSSYYYSPQLNPGPISSTPFLHSRTNGAPSTPYSSRGCSDTPSFSRGGPSTPSTPRMVPGQCSTGSTGLSSPYSNFFQRDYSPDPSNSSVYISSRESSRPNSQMSDYYLGDYLSSPGAGLPGRRGLSCPNTPLSSRRSYSPCPTSPGWIRPSPSSGWIRSSPSTYSSRSKSVSDKRSVYSLLFRPDLIKLSSPLCSAPSEPARSGYDTEEEQGATEEISQKIYVSEKVWIPVNQTEKMETNPHLSNGVKERETTYKASVNHTPYKIIQELSQKSAKSDDTERPSLQARDRFYGVGLTHLKINIDRKRQIELESADQVARQHTNQVARQHTDQVARQHTNQVARQHTDQVVREHTENVARQHTDQVARQHTNQVAHQHTDQVAREHTNQVARQNTDQVARQNTNQVARRHTDLFNFDSPRKGVDNTYTEYFDNLIALMDDLTKELSV